MEKNVKNLKPKKPRANYVLSRDGTRVLYSTIPKMQAIMNASKTDPTLPEFRTMKEAANYIVNVIRPRNPAKGVSGWGRDERHESGTLPEVYFLWDPKKEKHVKVSMEKDPSPGNTRTNAQRAENAIRGKAPVKKPLSGKPLPRKPKAPNPFLEKIMGHHQFATANDAAAHVNALKKKNPAPGMSGWGVDLRKVELPKVYYLWKNGKHQKIPAEKMEPASSDNARTNLQRAENATKPGGKRRDYVYKINGKRVYTTKIPFLEDVVQYHQPRFENIHQAAAHIYGLRQHTPETGKSGWGVDARRFELPRVYYHWTGSKHVKIPEANMHSTNLEKTNAQRAENALGRLKMSKQNRKLVDVIAHRFGITQHEALGLLGNARAAPQNRGQGYFHYGKNRYVSADGTVVPGNVFAQTYENIKNQPLRPNFAPENAEHVVSKISRNATIAEARALEAKRAVVDEDVLAMTRDKPLSEVIEALMSIGGPLDARPMITGNVGTPGDVRSPFEQLQNRTGNGCTMRNKRWPMGQGGSLEPHQAVVFAVCNIVARAMMGDPLGRRQPGLLALHSVGAGKTYELVSAIVAFWNVTMDDDAAPIGIFPVSVRSNFASGNDMATMATGAMLLFPWFRSTLVDEDLPEYPFLGTLDEVKARITHRLRLGHQTCGAPRDITENHLLGSFATLDHDVFGYQRKRGYLSNPQSRYMKDRRDKKKMHHCVFLVDEIQMLFAPPDSEKQYVGEYERMRRLLTEGRDAATTFVLGLTATPGDTVDVVNDIMRAITADSKLNLTPRKNGTVPQNQEKNIRDMVSVAYVSGDRTQFPQVKVTHECIQLSRKTNNWTADGNYWTLYINTVKRFKESHTNAQKFVIDNFAPETQRAVAVKNAPRGVNNYNKDRRFYFMRRTRRATEWVPILRMPYKAVAKHGKHDEEDDDGESDAIDVGEMFDQYIALAKKPRGHSPVILGKTGETEKCWVVSPKIVGVVSTCVTEPGIHFVYAADWFTLRFIAFLLSTRYGFRQYTGPQDTSFAPRFCFINPVKPPPATTLYDPEKERFVPAHAPVTATMVSGLLDKKRGILKNDINKNGDVVKVVLASKESFKGVDINAIRHIHCVSAMPDWIDMLQLVGRGTRNCGHDALPQKAWTCIVHLWQLIAYDAAGKQECSALFPDCCIYKRAYDSYEGGYKKVEESLGNNAVDRVLFQQYSAQFTRLQEDLRKQCQRDAKMNVIPRFPPHPQNALFAKYQKKLKTCTPACTHDHVCNETTGRCVSATSNIGKYVLNTRHHPEILAAQERLKTKARTPTPPLGPSNVPLRSVPAFFGKLAPGKKRDVIVQAYRLGTLVPCPQPCAPDQICNHQSGKCLARNGELGTFVAKVQEHYGQIAKTPSPVRTTPSLAPTVRYSPIPTSLFRSKSPSKLPATSSPSVRQPTPVPRRSSSTSSTNLVLAMPRSTPMPRSSPMPTMRYPAFSESPSSSFSVAQPLRAGKKRFII
jgi:hypothetical protein